MDTERCWEIIEAARVKAGTEWNELDERLEEALIDQLVRLLHHLAADLDRLRVAAEPGSPPRRC